MGLSLVKPPMNHHARMRGISSELLAVVCALCFSGAFVSFKRGAAGTSLVGAVLVTLGSGWLVVLVATAIDPPTSVSRDGLLLFGLTGVVAPGIGYSAALAGVARLGPSISVPIQQGTRPLISVGGATWLLGESVTALQLVGVAAIVAGSIGLSRRDGDGSEAGRNNAGAVDDPARSLRPGVAYALTAAVSFGSFDLLVKHALGIMDEPAFAATVTLGSGFLAWVLLALLVPSLRARIRIGPGVGWVALGGVFFGCAALSVFHALLDGRVSLVAPILACQPLLVWVLSAALLRNIESIRAPTLLFGTLVVCGALLVVL
jgi:drug/metabolite transporter (DMT)-like permease